MIGCIWHDFFKCHKDRGDHLALIDFFTAIQPYIQQLGWVLLSWHLELKQNSTWIQPFQGLEEFVEKEVNMLN